MARRAVRSIDRALLLEVLDVDREEDLPAPAGAPAAACGSAPAAVPATSSTTPPTAAMATRTLRTTADAIAEKTLAWGG
jgi:hypothetical protein